MQHIIYEDIDSGTIHVDTHHHTYSFDAKGLIVYIEYFISALYVLRIEDANNNLIFTAPLEDVEAWYLSD